jgi:hypothetical protein
VSKFPWPTYLLNNDGSAQSDWRAAHVLVAQQAWYFLYNNFCRVHMTLKTTPAVKAGIAAEKWTVEKLLDELATHC